MSSNSDEIFNATVTFPGAEVFTQEILNIRPEGFRVASLVNQGAETLQATYKLYGWDDKLADWIEEPLAIFNAQPAGVALKTSDTFTSTHSEKFRVGITPLAGNGPVIMAWSHTFA